MPRLIPNTPSEDRSPLEDSLSAQGCQAKQRRSLQLIWWGVLTLSIVTASPLLAADGNYVAFELPRGDDFTPLFMQDMDGDGRKDIIVPHYDRTIGRELHIHRQLADGGFAPQPQRIDIKTEIIAVGFADLRDDPGMELVLFAADGVFSLSTRQEGYVDNLKLLLQWQLIATLPDRERLRFTGLLPDVNGDGKADLLLPGMQEWGLFYGDDAEGFIEAARFTTLNQELTATQRRNRSTGLNARLAINSEEGVVIEMQAETPSPYAGFLELWRGSDGHGDSDEPDDDNNSLLLNSATWLPNASFVDLDTAPGLDLVYINTGSDGLGQLNIHSQQPDGGFLKAADWSGSINTTGQLRLADFNADGLADLLRLSGDGDEWVARFYINRGGVFDLESPQQVMRFAGYDVRLETVELPGRSTPVLGVAYYTIPAMEAIRNAAVNRVQLIYDSEAPWPGEAPRTGEAPRAGGEARPGEPFAHRPAFRLEETFSADSVRGLAEPASLRFDVDGDGRNDALYITGDGTLAARRVNDDLTLEREPFWEYVPTRTVLEYEVLHLNEDSLPDLILHHGTTTTFLTAVP